MALKQNNRGRWCYDKTFGRSYRYREILPENIKTEVEALEYIKTIPREKYRGYDIRPKYKDVKALMNHAIGYYRSKNDIEFHNNIAPFLEYCLDNDIGVKEIYHISPNLIEYYSQSRLKSCSVKSHNNEIKAIAKLHSYLSADSNGPPLSFDINKFLLKDPLQKKQNHYFSEKFYEILIKHYPEKFMGNKYTIIQKPIGTGNLLPDCIMLDENGTYYVVEIEKHHLDRNHSYKILEYRDKIEKKLLALNNDAMVKMMVILIGDDCPADRELFMKKYDIEFIKLSIKQIENIILDIVSVHKPNTITNG